MSDKIFFSYSRHDSAFVLKLASDLRDAGANIWLDQLDIPPGKHWDSEIEAALNNSNCLLAILSPKSMGSNNVMDEISFALEENKKVIPVLLTNTETPFRLRRLQRVDFTGNYDKGFRQLLTSLNLENEKSPVVNIPLVVPDKTQADNKVLNERIANQQELLQKETDLWQKTCSLNTLHAYQAYLDKTELKQHSDEARNYLYKLTATTVPKETAHFPEKATFFSGYRKMYLLVTIGLIGLTIITWAAFRILNKEPSIQAEGKSQKNVLQVVAENKDSVNKEVNNTATINETTALPPTREDDTPISQPENKITPKKETVIKQNKVAIKKEVPVKNYVPETITTTQKKDVANENKDAENAPAPAVERKEFVINSRVTVNVRLAEMPDMDQRKKSEQFVKFTVTRAVEYQGVVIIRQGAVARGSLTIGSRLADITINLVEGANGKMILLKAENDRIKRNEIGTVNTFNAIVQYGTRFSY